MKHISQLTSFSNNQSSDCISRWFSPDWLVPHNVHSLITYRTGGVSEPPYTSFNLAQHVGDDEQKVNENRAILLNEVKKPLAWLSQVHSKICVNAQEVVSNLEKGIITEADASYAVTNDVAPIIMTADCLPILLCNEEGSWVAAAHGGWKGLVGGVIEDTVKTVPTNSPIRAYLGPAIGKEAFEVGEDVLEAFLQTSAPKKKIESCFYKLPEDKKYLADIYLLASALLNEVGVYQISFDHDACTVIEREKYYSYRRDGVTGRMASLIWMD